MRHDPSDPGDRSPVFVSTQWTVVLRAQGKTAEARAALGELCETYWMPVFRFLRREGRDEDQARDLAQEFFSRLLSRGGLERADPALGRFRSYLLGALKHFLADMRRHEGRQKRGGNVVIESIEEGGTPDSPGQQIPDPAGPVSDAYFDRQWALAVMEQALAQVESDLKAAGKGDHYPILRPWLVGDADSMSQGEAAARLGMTLGAFKVAIHRLRKDFRKAVHDEIAQTLNRPSDADEELRYLIEVLS